MSARNDRLRDLRIDRALAALPADDEQELAQLLGQRGWSPGALDYDAFAIAAAQATLAELGPTRTAPPAALTARLEADALGYLVRERQLRLAQLAGPPRIAAPGPRRWPRWPTLVIAVAAASVLAHALLWRGAGTTTTPPIDVAIARAELLRDAEHLVRLDWHSGPANPGGALHGDVVWHRQRHVGFLRFVGLPPNDPTQSRYQLWIFDRGRDAATPVDGGVFDARRDVAEQVVPIDAHLAVGDAFAFAVTLERPDGVVVSDRVRLIATAGL